MMKVACRLSFIFPYQITNEKTNKFLSSNTPNVRIEYKGRLLDAVFDTGNVKSDFGNKFVQMFSEALSGLVEHEGCRGESNYENMFVRGER